MSFIQVFRNDLEPTKRVGVDYSESFHVVVIADQHDVHVWRIEISTPTVLDAFDEDQRSVQSRSHHNSTSNPEDVLNHGNNPDDKFPSIITTLEKACKKSFLNISINKVLQQTLCSGLSVIYSACAGHFVCGSSYALISTTKECVKMWKLLKTESTEKGRGNGEEYDVSFQEWNSLPAYKEKGQLLQASAAYSGRIACVYKLDREKEKESMTTVNGCSSNEGEKDGPVELSNCTCAVNVYQCESTGGKKNSKND